MSGVAESPTTYTYSPTTGQLTTVTAPDGSTVSYAYRGPLRLSTTWAGGPSGVSGVVGRTHDALFRVTSRSVTAPATGTAQSAAYGYDNDGLLTSVGGMTVTPDPVHGMETVSAIGVVTTNRTYNPTTGELASQTASVSGTQVFAVTYSYDNAGRITQRVETVQGATPATTTYDYRYDSAGRLFEVGPLGAPIERYTYDANGNRLRRLGDATDWAYDAQDRLTTRPTSPTATETFTYNDDGSLRTRVAAGNTTTFDYDERGSLRRAESTSPAIRVDYTLDALGRRIERIRRNMATGGTITEQDRFLYDGRRVVARLGASNNLLQRYVYGTRDNVPDLIVASDGTTYRVIADHLGSVRFVVNTVTGAVMQRMRYDAYGRELENTSPGWQPFGYAGGLYDRETRLVRFGARDYDPELGRWVSKDPETFGGGSNLFAYADSNPVNVVDPDGDIPIAVFAAAGAIGFAVGFIGSAVGSYAATGHVNWRDAAVSGVAGGLAGLALPVSWRAAALAGAVSSIGAYAVTQRLNGQPVDGATACVLGGVGAIGGGVAGRFQLPVGVIGRGSSNIWSRGMFSQGNRVYFSKFWDTNGFGVWFGGWNYVRSLGTSWYTNHPSLTEGH